MQSGVDLRAAVLKAGLWLALVVALAPPVAAPLGVGLDASYAWGLDALPETGSLHGRDVVFPYGPLGGLLLPVVGEGAGGAWRAAVLGRLGFHLLFALLLAVRLRGVSLARAAAAAALLLLAELLGLYFDSRLLLLLALLLGPALVGGCAEGLPAECLGKEGLGGGAGPDPAGRGRRLPFAGLVSKVFGLIAGAAAGGLSVGVAALAGALAAVFVLMKVNLGIAAVALVAAAFGLAAVRARRSAAHSGDSGARRGGGFAWTWVAGGLAFLGVALLALPLFGGMGGRYAGWPGSSTWPAASAVR